MINFLIENKIEPENKECLIESIKCHHIDISNYLF